MDAFDGRLQVRSFKVVEIQLTYTRSRNHIITYSARCARLGYRALRNIIINNNKLKNPSSCTHDACHLHRYHPISPLPPLHHSTPTKPQRSRRPLYNSSLTLAVASLATLLTLLAASTMASLAALTVSAAA
jgi:hypothetical protein